MRNISKEDMELLKLIHQSNITIDDIRWLNSKRRFKRYVNTYKRELENKVKSKSGTSKDVKTNDNDVEVLDFTKTISLPSSELLEMLGFAKDMDISSVEELKDITDKIKKKLRKEQLIWSSVLILCIMIFSSIGVYLISWQLENNKTKNLVDKMKAVAKSDATTTTTTKLGDDVEAPVIDSSINFDNLLKMNSDTKGWINVKGTNIDYAFVQTSDNDYYLEHSFDKSYNKKGWVFLDYRNDINDLKDNTILYAHGLLNKVMFGTLKKVVTEDWYKNEENRKVLITIPNGYYLWEVFSTYTIEPESYYITTKFKDKDAHKKFIETITKRSVYDYGVKVTTNDKILTLSSCYDHSKRVVLHAKLIKKG